MTAFRTEHVELAGLPGPAMEDKDLTLAFQRGEKGAYQAIHDRHAARVRNVCLRMLGNRDDAQEAAQETFLRVYQALGRFNGRYQMGAWITRIATNVCLDHLRARSRKTGEDTSFDEIEVLEPIATGDEYDPATMCIRNAEGRSVRKTLAALPPMHRAAIVLRDFEGLSYEEVAVALGMSGPQVKALIHRARQNFKRSWVSRTFGFLVPPRLVGELRGIEHASQPLVPSISHASQFASSCAAVLQQCGQALVDKAAALVTVGAIGVAAATSTAGANPSIPPEPVEVVAVDSSSVVEVKGRVVRRQTHESTPDAVVAAEPEPTSPSTEEEPAQDAPPVADEGDADAPDPQPSPTHAPAEPSPPLLSFGAIGASEAVVPTADETTIDCAGRPAIDQHLSTSIWFNGETYPAALALSSASGLSIALTVTKDGVDVYYPGGAALVGEFAEDGLIRLTYHGAYSALDQNKATAAGLPSGGEADIELTFDCSRELLISETAVFAL